MNIFNKVTLKSLLKNRTRTIVTIIGIILSTAMFTAVTTFVSSLQAFMIKSSVYVGGDWHGTFQTASSEIVEEVKSSDEIEWASVSQNLGFAKLTSDKDLYKKYFYILGTDETFAEHIPVRITEGRMFENSNEIILSQTLLSDEDYGLNIGNQITLDIGIRSQSEEEMLQLSNNTLYNEEELFEPLFTRTYTIVGSYSVTNDSTSSAGYYALTMYDASVSTDYYDIYFGATDISKTYEILSEIGSVGYCFPDDNSDLLMMYGVSKYESFLSVLVSLSVILIALIMLGSVSLIYNAFSISVCERTKQFGLLSSIGATRRQIRRSVFFEAFAVSVIGIPLGILSGITGIGITLLCLSSAFTSLFAGDIPFGFSLEINPYAILIAAAVALLTVVISAWVPSAIANRITAIDAIRQSKDIKTGKRIHKTPQIVYRLFGPEGAIASKHFRRNRKSYRSTVISLFISIVLFISSSSFCSYLSESVNGVYSKNCDVQLYYVSSECISQSDLDVYEEASALEGIEDKLFLSSCIYDTYLDRSCFTKEYLTFNGSESAQINPCVELMIIDDENFRKYAEDIGQNPDDYFESASLKGILCEHISYIDYELDKYSNKDILAENIEQISLSTIPLSEDEITATEETIEYEPTEIAVGAVTAQCPSMTDGICYYLRLYIPASLAIKYADETAVFNSSRNNNYCRFATSQHAELTESLEKIEQSELANVYYSTTSDIASQSESSNNIIMIIYVFSYGFIVLISLIAAANVFNTISTGIMLRRREFAVLKSIGMTKRGFNKMMNYECLLYGLKSLLYGLPASVGITYLIFLSVNSGWEVGFYIPWQAMLIAILSVFVVVFSTMLYSMRKIKNDNPIEALRNDNI